MSDQVKVYFEGFGKVNSVNIRQKEHTHLFYGSVEFGTAEIGAKVLSNALHRIDGRDVTVTAAELSDQSDQILNALDNDCLQANFSRLNLSELMSAANACIRFGQQAKPVFSAKHKKLDLSKCCRDEIINALQSFGSVAQSIDLAGGSVWHETAILSALGKNCAPLQICAALNELTLRDFHFEMVNWIPKEVKLDLALGRVEKLSLFGCHFMRNLFNLISVCGNLKVLHIEQCYCYRDNEEIPELIGFEELRLIDNNCNNGFVGADTFKNNIDARFVNAIVSSNPTITKLSLIGLSDAPMEIVRVIVDKLPNLLELEVKGVYCTSTSWMRHLSQLPSVTVLKLNLKFDSATPLNDVLTRNVWPIEHMELSNGRIYDDTVNAISTMTRLKNLEFYGINGLIGQHMINLAQRLGRQLEQLQLYDGVRFSKVSVFTWAELKEMLRFTTRLSLLTLVATDIAIEEDDYKAMVKILNERPANIGLTLKLMGADLNVPGELQNEHRDVLSISN